jgi:hypothetical protein
MTPPTALTLRRKRLPVRRSPTLHDLAAAILGATKLKPVSA